MNAQKTLSDPNESLFAGSPRPRPSILTIILFIVSAGLVFGGFYLMGVAFNFTDADQGPTWFLHPAIVTFFSAIVIDTIGFFIAFQLLAKPEDKEAAA